MAEDMFLDGGIIEVDMFGWILKLKQEINFFELWIEIKEVLCVYYSSKAGHVSKKWVAVQFQNERGSHEDMLDGQ